MIKIKLFELKLFTFYYIQCYNTLINLILCARTIMKNGYLLSGVVVATTMMLTGCLEDKPKNPVASQTPSSATTETTTIKTTVTSTEAKAEPAGIVKVAAKKEDDEVLGVERNVKPAPDEPASPMITYDHSGVQKGAKFNICSREPCSTVEVLDFKQLSKRPAHSDIELTIKTGYYNTETKTQTWDKKTQKVTVNCSYELPTISAMGVSQVIPLNPNGLSSTWLNSGMFYTKACHNELDYRKVVDKFEYNVAELPSG